jgi:hypothetical protein
VVGIVLNPLAQRAKEDEGHKKDYLISKNHSSFFSFFADPEGPWSSLRCEDLVVRILLTVQLFCTFGSRLEARERSVSLPVRFPSA